MSQLAPPSPGGNQASSVFDDYSDDRVAVVIRLRPPQDEEEDVNEIFCARGNVLTIRDPLSRGRNEHNYSFNDVFLPEHGQQYVFEGVAQPLIDRLLAGFNSCCFAYGQTGSGKTHSIFGEGNADQRGVLARSLEYLFGRIERRASQKEVGMVVSFTEIYLDQVRDLGRFYTHQKNGTLDELVRRDATTDHLQRRSSSKDGSRSSTKETSDVYLSQDLAIHETPQGIVYVEDLTLIPVSNIREVLDVVNLGVRMRATYETRLNTRSSRSHTIFTVSIVQKSRQSDDILSSVVNFVDLAGSERLARSQSEGRRFQEAVVINSSLSALGKVVLALASDPKATRHVPYRDSKLTRMLQNSLGGNSFTTLLTTIDPSPINYEESLNSLSFADRCKNVLNKPLLGHIEQEESQERILHRLAKEVATLKHELETLNAGFASFNDMSSMSRQITPGSEIAKGGSAPAQGDLAQKLETAPSTGAALPQRPRGDSEIPSSHNAETSSASGSNAAEDEEAAEQLQRIQVEAELRLEHEREQTKAAEAKADQAMVVLEKARQDLAQREQRRKQEDTDAKRRIKGVEVEIAKAKSSIVNVSSSIAVEQERELRSLEANTSEVARSREDLLRKIPPAFSSEVNPAAIEASLESREAERATEVAEQRAQQMRSVRESHARDLKALEVQQAQWLQDREAAAQRTAAAKETCHSQHQRWHRQMSGELMDAYNLLCKLSKAADSLEAGVPAQLKIEIQPPALQLSGLRARLKKEGVLPDRIFEQLSRGVADLWRDLAHYEQLLPQEKGSGAKANSQAPAVASSAPAASCEAMPAWDADAFARDFCDFREAASANGTSSAQASLQRLDAVRLRALCASLRKRVRMSAEEQEAERSRLRDEVAKNLAAHDRVDQIRQLEKDIADYKFKVCYEEGRARHLEIALHAYGRSASRPGSRSNSRPTSRPASAGPGAGVPRLNRPVSGGRTR